MKIPNLIHKNKLQASARRMPRRVAEECDEPNMRLSSAFVVVLLLHVVAVGGIYAFNTIKARRAASQFDDPPAISAQKQAEPLLPAAAEIAVARIAPDGAGRVYQVQPGDTLEKIAAMHGIAVGPLEDANRLKREAILRVGQELRIPDSSDTLALRPSPPPSSSPPKTHEEPKAGSVKNSGETYTVVKGDNPVAIARRLEVNYSELLHLNNIDDPRKLQIGQKLKVPVKRK